MRKLGTFARYGARIDKDIGRALQALRTLRDRPDAWIDGCRTARANPAGPRRLRGSSRTNCRRARSNLSSRAAQSRVHERTAARTSEPGPAAVAPPPVEPAWLPAAEASCTSEPAPRLNRQQRPALAARLRRRAA